MGSKAYLHRTSLGTPPHRAANTLYIKKDDLPGMACLGYIPRTNSSISGLATIAAAYSTLPSKAAMIDRQSSLQQSTAEYICKQLESTHSGDRIPWQSLGLLRPRSS